MPALVFPPFYRGETLPAIIQRRLYSFLNDSGGILDHHSGPILATCSGRLPKSGQLRTGINGQLPPEWVANFIPESVSTLPRNTQTGFAAAFGGGAQIPMQDRYEFRVSADYVLSTHNLTGVQSLTQNNFRVSAGIVLKLGKR